jgi:hypothetical protein
MPEWCTKIQGQLEQMFLSGKIDFRTYRMLADCAESIIVRCEGGMYDWGTIEADELFQTVAKTMGVPA